MTFHVDTGTAAGDARGTWHTIDYLPVDGSGSWTVTNDGPAVVHLADCNGADAGTVAVRATATLSASTYVGVQGGQALIRCSRNGSGTQIKLGRGG